MMNHLSLDPVFPDRVNGNSTPTVANISRDANFTMKF